MSQFVYIIDRDGELDVYADFGDAQEAAQILNEGTNPASYEIVEQAVFAPSGRERPEEYGTTRAWLDDLRDRTEERGIN